MTRAILWLFGWLIVVAGLRGATTIGPEAAVTLPSSTTFRMHTPFEPEDGSVQGLNPPVFKWPYWIPSTLQNPNYPPIVYTFKFQCSSNSNFSDTIWDITCSNNFYNYLPPITNAFGATASNYWRIVYLNSNATATVYTSPTHHFTLSATPTNWDRSLLADATYLQSVGVHPHMFFWETNRDAVISYVKTNTQLGFSFTTLSNTYYSYTLQSWWNTNDLASITPPDYVAHQIANVAWLYQMTTNATFLGSGSSTLCGMANALALSWMAQHRDHFSDAYVMGNPQKSLALIYDYLYNDMNAGQRANVLLALEQNTKFFLYNNWWYLNGGDTFYLNPLTTVWYSGAMRGSSHERDDAGAGLFMTVAAMKDSAFMREAQSYFLNYLIAQYDPAQGDEGYGYAMNTAFQVTHNPSAIFLANCVFREMHLSNAPIVGKIIDQLAHLQPLHVYNTLNHHGDSAPTPGRMYFDSLLGFSRIYGSGALLRHYSRANVILSDRDVVPLWGDLYIPYYFPGVPAETDWPTNYFDAASGWSIASTYPPNDWNAWTNGCGFALTARTGGNRVEHGTWHDGALYAWAYGAQVTIGGTGTDNYQKYPWAWPGLLVDGIGVNTTVAGHVGEEDYSMKHIAWTNTGTFTYSAVELARAYNRSNIAPMGGWNTCYGYYNLSTNRRPYVTSVQRHVLFPSKKYWVVYDSLVTTQAAQFQWRWNVYSNSITINTSGVSFAYNVPCYPNGGHVYVDVAHIVDPTTMTLTNLAGEYYARVNPFTGEDYNASFNANIPLTYHNLWVYNKVPTTNWHFLSVIYPRKPGSVDATTIIRIDDYSVSVANAGDGIADVITFNPDSPPPGATYIVDTEVPVTTATPVFIPSQSIITASTNVLIHVREDGATLHWWTNSSTTTNYVAATNYTVNGLIVGDTLNAYATNANRYNSGVRSVTFTATATVPMPVITPASGSYYVTSTNATITCTDASATIYWTTNAWSGSTNSGSSPQTVATFTTTPFTISAYAANGTDTNSAVTNAIITLLGAPNTNATTGQLRATRVNVQTLK